MDQALSLRSALTLLSQDVQRDMRWQMMKPAHPHYGAYIGPESGLDEAGHGGTSRFIVSCGYLLLAQQTHPEAVPEGANQETLLMRMDLALDYLLRAQRPSGLIDLRSTNYDSSPDTGFVLELFCAFYELARGQGALEGVLGKIETFIRRAVPGLLTGGFHTPNHRWVMVSALTQAARLLPDLEAAEVVRAYLAEGFDADEEGVYIERSAGIYDAVSDRALLFIADNCDEAATVGVARQAVAKNLDFNLYLLHADGTAETGLSRRQDHGVRAVPGTLITPYLYAAAVLGEARYRRAAQWLWEKAPRQDVHDAHWLAYALMKFGDPAPSPAQLPEAYVKTFPLNGLWRARQGELSASVFGGGTRLMTLVYRSAEMTSLKISQTYFGVGLFLSDELSGDASSVTLLSTGQQKPNLPGYDLPLGRPVPRERWQETRLERDYRPLPPARSLFRVVVTEDGLECHYRTLDGLAGVAAQVALDFPSGGLWETASTAFETEPGQVILLKDAYGTMRFGDDAIRIGPGAFGHRYLSMRHAEPVLPGQVRVLLTFLTPVDHRFSLRVFSGLEP